MESVLVVAVLAALVCGFIAGELGKRKGRFAQGFWFGFLLGPVGIAIVAMDAPTPAAVQARAAAATAGMKKCPACAEWVKDEAVLCRYCSTDLRKPTTQLGN